MAQYYKLMFKREIDNIIKYFDKSQYLIVKYEDLVDKTSKLIVLARVVDFIGHSTTHDRLNCSFELSDRYNLLNNNIN